MVSKDATIETLKAQLAQTESRLRAAENNIATHMEHSADVERRLKIAQTMIDSVIGNIITIR